MGKGPEQGTGRIAIHPQTPLTVALGVLHAREEDLLPVWDGGWLIGVCTRRSCETWMAYFGRHLHDATVADAMKPNLVHTIDHAGAKSAIGYLRADATRDFVSLNHDEDALMALSCGQEPQYLPSTHASVTA